MGHRTLVLFRPFALHSEKQDLPLNFISGPEAQLCGSTLPTTWEILVSTPSPANLVNKSGSLQFQFRAGRVDKEHVQLYLLNLEGRSRETGEW